MDNPERPEPPTARRGPRPLLLHLALAAMRAHETTSSGSPSGLPNWSAVWTSAMPGPAAKLAPSLSSPPDALAPANRWLETQGPDRKLIAGIAAYRRHPWRREVPEPPEIWSSGATRLLDYGGSGPCLLLVPSLINRAFVLDLMQDHSMARHLAGAGLRVLLLDWGWPGPEERLLGLSGTIITRLVPAMQAAAEASGGRIVLGGYCMGGLLTVAAAQLRPDLVAGLALLATPWNFHAAGPDIIAAIAPLLQMLEPVMALSGAMPIDMLQYLFTLGDPHGVGDKFRAFGRMQQDGCRATQFVAIEDWLNDGVPLPAPLARECLDGWYGQNSPMLGQWCVAGTVVDPACLALPSFVAVPEHDRIVPPGSAMPLAEAIAGATVIRPRAGHVSMVAGARAESLLWRHLQEWALSLS